MVWIRGSVYLRATAEPPNVAWDDPGTRSYAPPDQELGEERNGGDAVGLVLLSVRWRGERRGHHGRRHPKTARARSCVRERGGAIRWTDRGAGARGHVRATCAARGKLTPCSSAVMPAAFDQYERMKERNAPLLSAAGQHSASAQGSVASTGMLRWEKGAGRKSPLRPGSCCCCRAVWPQRKFSRPPHMHHVPTR